MKDNKFLEEMHAKLAEALLKKIQDGSATASDLNVARQFLKDNGIEVSNFQRHTPLQQLSQVVPFAAEA